MSDEFSRLNVSSARLGDVIRQRRLELKLSQEALAERISTDDEYVRQSDISNLERGRVQLPRRQRLERIAAALDLPLGQLLALSGWSEADRHLVATLTGVPLFAVLAPLTDTQQVSSAHYWWQNDAEAVRIITSRFTHNHFDSIIDGYRNAAMWMATSGQGLCGFLILTDDQRREIVSLGFWKSETAMLHSAASLVLPERIMRLGDQLAEPPLIERYRLVDRIVHDNERNTGRMAQLDRAEDPLGVTTDAVPQFRRYAMGHHDHRPHLRRAALLVDLDLHRPTTIGIWHPETTEGQHGDNQHGARFPQLLKPADSHDYQVAIEV